MHGRLGERAFRRKREEYDPESGMRAASGRIAEARVGVPYLDGTALCRRFPEIFWRVE